MFFLLCLNIEFFLDVLKTNFIIVQTDSNLKYNQILMEISMNPMYKQQEMKKNNELPLVTACNYLKPLEIVCNYKSKQLGRCICSRFKRFKRLKPLETAYKRDNE